MQPNWSTNQRRIWRKSKIVKASVGLGVAGVAALAMVFVQAEAVNLYVSPTGSDTNNGKTVDAPFKSIQKALDIATPGTTINLAEGAYHQLATTKVAGTADAPITIQGPETGTDVNGRYKAVLYADPASNNGTGIHTFDINHSYYTLKGFTIDGQPSISNSEYPTDAAQVRSFKDSVQSRAINSKLIYVGASTTSKDITGVKVDDMFLNGSGGECLRLRNNAFGNTVSNSVIQWCGMYGAGDDQDKYKYHNAEGIYIGTSPKSTDQPMYANDTGSGNVISNSIIRTYGSECFNIKENAHDNTLRDSQCMYNDEPLAFNGSNIELRGDHNHVDNVTVSGSRGYNVKLWSDETKYDKGGNSIRLSSLSNSSAAAISNKQATATMGEFCGLSFAGNASQIEGNSVGNPTTPCVDPNADTQPPTVTITAPTANASVSGAVTIKADATDNAGVTKIEFLVNGALIGTTAAAPYQQVWNVPAVAGSYTLTAKAYDAKGNVGTSGVVVTVAEPTTHPTPTTPPINLEAESGTLTAPMIAYTDSTAQGGKYINQASGSGTGKAVYSFTVTTAGTYQLSGRVKTSGSSANSFYYSFDGASQKAWELPSTASSWTWTPTISQALSAGSHKLTIYKKENGTKLDALSLTLSASTTPSPAPSPTPTPTPPTTPPAINATSLFEAEAGKVSGGMAIQADSTASGGSYVLGKSSGTVTYTIQVAAKATYMIAGWIKAPNASSDSVNVKVDSGSYASWDLQDPTSKWTYDATNNPTFSLSAGTHTLTVQYREPNAALDRLVLVKQ